MQPRMENKMLTPGWAAKGERGGIEFGAAIGLATAAPRGTAAPGRAAAGLAPRTPRFRPYGELAALPAGTTEADLEATGLVLVQELDAPAVRYTAWEPQRELANRALGAAAAELGLPPVTLRWYGVVDSDLDFSLLPMLPGGQRWWEKADTRGFVQYARRRELWLKLPCADPVGAVAHECRHLWQLATQGYHARCDEAECQAAREQDAAAFAADFAALWWRP